MRHFVRNFLYCFCQPPQDPKVTTGKMHLADFFRLVHDKEDEDDLQSAQKETAANNKRKDETHHKQASAQKKQALTLHGLFGKAQDSQSQRPARPAVTNTSPMVDQKKRGGNNINKIAVKKLKVALSTGHTMNQCRGMIDTHKPVADARLK